MSCASEQTASQIVSGLRANPFHQKHFANAATLLQLTRKIGRSSLEVYIQPLRAALGQAFREAQLQLDPCKVLVSEETSSNTAGRGNYDLIPGENRRDELEILQVIVDRDNTQCKVWGESHVRSNEA